MAVTLTGTGGLFTRLGRIFFGIKSANLLLGASDISAGGLKSVGVTFTDILAQFASTLQNVPDKSGVGLTAGRDTVRAALTAWKNVLKALAEQTLIEQVHLDATLTTKTVEVALIELIRQMIGSGTIYAPDNDVDASTVSATWATVTGIVNVGNGAAVGSVLRAKDARPNELLFVEVLEAECTSDVNTGAAARSEVFAIKGEVTVTDKIGWDYPTGSGASTSIVACDADDNGASSALYGGNFDSFTTLNKPDYFGDPLVGVYGTDIFEEATTVYRAGGKALKFTGTGGTPLSSIAQSFGVASPAVATSGTSFVLEPGVVYHVNLFMRKSASLLAGNIQVRLLDSTNTQVTDDAGSNIIPINIAHGTITTAFASYSGSFVMPKTATPTTTYKLNVRVSTALTSGESVYIDDLAMCEATELYPLGPYGSIFAGSTNFLLGDRLNLSIANNRAGDFMEWFDRVFSMKAKDLQLPSDSAGTETIVDTLIA